MGQTGYDLGVNCEAITIGIFDLVKFALMAFQSNVLLKGDGENVTDCLDDNPRGFHCLKECSTSQCMKVR